MSRKTESHSTEIAKHRQESMDTKEYTCPVLPLDSAAVKFLTVGKTEHVAKVKLLCPKTNHAFKSHALEKLAVWSGQVGGNTLHCC